MKSVPLNGDVFVSDLFLGDLNVFNSLFWDILRNVLSEIFNSVVVSYCDFFGDSLDFSLLSVFDLLDLLGNSFNFGLILVFDDLLLEGNVFDSALSFNHFFASINGGSNDLSIGGHGSGGWDGSGGSIVSSSDGVFFADSAGSTSIVVGGSGSGGGDIVGSGGGDVSSVSIGIACDIVGGSGGVVGA